ncbi:serine/threonine kinase [Aureococcus anophagefferens]|nr:serine/threonine kinase [Aureococcus anophagefferens]
MASAKKQVGKYEIGRTLGEGTFGKVKHAVNVETQEAVAIKVLDKERIQKQSMGSQIKKEISIMKQLEHANVVKLNEVLASRTKIFIVLELVTGGELFDRIVTSGKLNEHDARFYFKQLVGGVVAPEVLMNEGYDGRIADCWSIGVILYLVDTILVADPKARATLNDVQKNAWFCAADAGPPPAVEPAPDAASPLKEKQSTRVSCFASSRDPPALFEALKTALDAAGAQLASLKSPKGLISLLGKVRRDGDKTALEILRGKGDILAYGPDQPRAHLGAVDAP